jgi:hypothetical protein
LEELLLLLFPFVNELLLFKSDHFTLEAVENLEKFVSDKFVLLDELKRRWDLLELYRLDVRRVKLPFVNCLLLSEQLRSVHLDLTIPKTNDVSMGLESHPRITLGEYCLPISVKASIFHLVVSRG